MTIIGYCKNEIKYISLSSPLDSIKIEVINADFYQSYPQRLIYPVSVSFFVDNINIPQYFTKCYFKDSIVNLPSNINGIYINSLKHELRIYNN